MARYFEQSVRVDLSHSLTRSLTLLLMSRYVWIDWSSMPQPSACPPSVDENVKEELGTNLGKAVKSIPAYVVTHFSYHIHLNSHSSTFVNRYVEKSDFVVIVAPGCLHADRRDPDTKLRTKTCYRTYRNRGWCVLEMMCSLHSREKSTSRTSHHLR